MTEKSAHAVGDKIRLWKPQNHEHGLFATVDRVLSIEEYGGPDYPKHRGPHAYHSGDSGWSDGKRIWWRTAWPDALVVSEKTYQDAKRESRAGAMWRE